MKNWNKIDMNFEKNIFPIDILVKYETNQPLLPKNRWQPFKYRARAAPAIRVSCKLPKPLFIAIPVMQKKQQKTIDFGSTCEQHLQE